MSQGSKWAVIYIIGTVVCAAMIVLHVKAGLGWLALAMFVALAVTTDPGSKPDR